MHRLNDLIVYSRIEKLIVLQYYNPIHEDCGPEEGMVNSDFLEIQN